jgi:hypothetical protein
LLFQIQSCEGFSDAYATETCYRGGPKGGESGHKGFTVKHAINEHDRGGDAEAAEENVKVISTTVVCASSSIDASIIAHAVFVLVILLQLGYRRFLERTPEWL